MKIGFIGLGKMGYNMVLSLLDKKHKVVAYNRSPEPTRKLAKLGASPAFSFEELCQKLGKNKVILIMVPHGKPVDTVLNGLKQYIGRGDIIIDGGNSYYEDSIRRYNTLKKSGISYLDMGTSGGLYGARHGASLMIGGDKKSFNKIEKIFKDLAIKDGYAYLGESGAGHFVKIIHNGIEYGMLEAYGEGFEILHHGKYKLKYKDVAKVWAHGSVIRSWLMDLSQEAFTKNPNLKGIKGIIGGGTTGEWAYKIAKKEKVEASTLKHALRRRKESKKKQDFSTKFVAEMRNKFGGHKIEEG